MNGTEKWGPWPRRSVVDANRPTTIHATPTDNEATANKIREADNPVGDSDSAYREYGLNELVGVLAIHTKQLVESTRTLQPFTVSVRGPNHSVFSSPHGIIRTIVNNSGAPVQLNIGEMPTGDPTVLYTAAYPLPPGITECYIPFMRGIWCRMISAYPVIICGSSF